jgi:spermidine synthase
VSLVLSFAMFASGAAALLFETLWFRQAGLVLGNSVWASSLTLAAFMTGLAIGNAVIARYGERVRSPIRLYAGLEMAIAIAGVSLVWILPYLAAWLAPLWRPLIDQPLLLNGLRLVTSFALLLIPAIAMGATLPLLVKALLARDSNFGSVLGRLYGWNTLGAVAGAVAGELFLLGWLGVARTALVAAGSNTLAAAAALFVFWKVRATRTPEMSAATHSLRLSRNNWRPLAAVFLSGGILLALEVVWFRFLELFVWNSGASFALMLAVVLAGIGIGGRGAGFWLRARPEADRFAGPVALLAGTVAVLGYRSFSPTFSRLMGPSNPDLVMDTGTILALSVALTLPVSLLSGVLFTLVGTALQRVVSSEIASTGLLTLSNTLGGALGALAGGFLLLPILGIENSLFLLATLYGLVGLLLLSPVAAASVAPNKLRFAWIVPLAIALVLFPFGAMRGEHLKRVGASFGLGDEDSIAVVRETRTETLLLLRRRFLDETLNYWLVTGGFGMASTDEWSRRYMKQFVYLPLNLHSGPERALLISFGSGSTARALRDVASLREIDIVDISRDILEVSEVIYPGPSENPLDDERVHTHVDDGRFYLLTTPKRYDLITSEPPPPKHAGVVNLYTQEFFQLVKDRLAGGGINTHWLPSHALTYDDTRAIVRAYCEVFLDCTLWKGINLNWMLMGSRDADWTTSEAEFSARWESLRASREGHALGVELPEQLGAMFLGDSKTLREWTAGIAPLQDGFPKRLVDDPPSKQDYDALREWMRPEEARRQFRESAFIDKAWPAGLRDRTDRFFEMDGIVQKVFLQQYGSPSTVKATIPTVDSLLAVPGLEMLPAWLLGAHGDYLAVIDRNPDLRDRVVSLHMRGRRAIGRRRFAEASRLFRRLPVPTPESLFLDAYASAMAGDEASAASILRQNQARYPDLPWAWLTERFGLESVGAIDEAGVASDR